MKFSQILLLLRYTLFLVTTSKGYSFSWNAKILIYVWSPWTVTSWGILLGPALFRYFNLRSWGILLGPPLPICHLGLWRHGEFYWANLCLGISTSHHGNFTRPTSAYYLHCHKNRTTYFLCFDKYLTESFP